jgi:hypothetical protein
MMFCPENPAGALQFRAYLLARPGLLRYAIWRYRRNLAALRKHALIACRVRLLDRLAGLADRISSLEHRDPDTVTWMVAAELLRAVAASERGQVLAGLGLAGDRDLWPAEPCQVQEWNGAWAGLAARAGCSASDHGERAAILRRLAEIASAAEGIGVLADLADTELAAAQKVEQQERPAHRQRAGIADKGTMLATTFGCCVAAIAALWPWAGAPVAGWRILIAVIYGLCALSGATSFWWLPRLPRFAEAREPAMARPPAEKTSNPAEAGQ